MQLPDVYRPAEVRSQLVAALQPAGKVMKAGGLAMACGLPLWVVFNALDSAVRDGVLRLDVVRGYELVDQIKGCDHG